MYKKSLQVVSLSLTKYVEWNNALAFKEDFRFLRYNLVVAKRTGVAKTARAETCVFSANIIKHSVPDWRWPKGTCMSPQTMSLCCHSLFKPIGDSRVIRPVWLHLGIQRGQGKNSERGNRKFYNSRNHDLISTTESTVSISLAHYDLSWPFYLIVQYDGKDS